MRDYKVLLFLLFLINILYNVLSFPSVVPIPFSPTPFPEVPPSLPGIPGLGFAPPKFPAPAGDCVNLCSNLEGYETSFFRYIDGEVYKYKIEGLTSIHLPNSLKGESTKLNYAANFNLIVESKCSFILKIISVEITGPNGKKYTDRSLVGHPVKFSWSNGKLGNFCIDERETASAANIKRSIISNLQISHWSNNNPFLGSVSADSTTYENDVYGTCPITVESSQEQDGYWIIKKTKDLNQCKHRQGFDFAVGSNSYTSDSSQYANPFVQANLKSTTRVEKGLIKYVEVNEEYIYQPLTNYGDSQTSVVVTTKISLVGKGSHKTAPPSIAATYTPSSLLFETEKSSRTEATVPIIIKAIQDASNVDEDLGVLPSNIANEFTKLIKVLQQAKGTDILSAYAQVNSGAGFKYKNTARTAFWSGLIGAATPAAVETATTLLLNNEMPSEIISPFLRRFSFIKHPTEQTLSVIAALLDQKSLGVDRYLSVGALIKKYVQDHPIPSSPVLDTLISKLASPLSNGGASKTVEEEDLLIASLKGIKNAQYMSENVAQKVRDIATNQKATNRAKAAALQALAPNSSNEQNRNLALNILQNKEEDAELRIIAFLLYINTPSTDTAQTVKNLLDAEESEQVGSYIVSYLNNLRTSKNPEKELLKQYYSGIKTDRKFPFDFRQYSRNYQFSQLISSLNLGYSAESNVIFSSESYVPRSTSVALNSYLFGNAFNLLEIDARIENFEYMLEKYLGPRSYLKTNKAEDIADDFVDTLRNAYGKVRSKSSILSRGKRAIKKGSKVITQMTSAKTPLSENYLDLDLSFKLFNSELKWFNWHANKNKVATDELFDELFEKLESAIKNLKNLDVDYKKFYRSNILSDNIIYFPTCSGFPLKLSLDLSSVISFNVKGNLDIPKILMKPSSADIRFQIAPSAVIQADGVLEVDASILSAGLKASSSVRTATALELELKILDGNGYDFKLGFPVKEQDIFTMKTEAYTIVQERNLPAMEQLLKPAGKQWNYGGMFDQLSDLIGLSLVAEISSPAISYKPTVGPGQISIRLVKDDDKLQYYQFRAYYDTTKNNYRSLEIILDTPGSTINRKISLLIDKDSKERKISAKFISPVKQLYFEGIGASTDTELSYHVKFINDDLEYGADIGATITNEKYKTIYKPYLKLRAPSDVRDASLDKMRISPKHQAQLLNIDGLVILEKKRNSPTYRKYEFQGLGLTTPVGRFSVDGQVYVDTSYPQIGSDVVFSYGDTNTLQLKSYFDYLNNADQDKQLTANLSFIPSQWPMYSFRSDLQVRKTPSAIEKSLVLAHGPDLENDIYKLTIYNLLNTATASDGDVTAISDTFKVTYPLWKLKLDSQLEEQNFNYFSVYSTLVLDKTNMELNGSLGIGNKQIGNIDLQLMSKLNEKSLTLSASRELIDIDKSNVVIHLKTTPGKEVSITSNVTHTFKPLYYVFRAISNVTVSPNKLYNYDIGFKYTPSEKSVHLIAYPNNERSLQFSASFVKVYPKINANLIAYMNGIIDGTATFEKNDSKAVGDLNVNIIKSNRLITGNLELGITDNELYSGYADLLWDASKNPSKKAKVVTKTKVTNNGRSLDSQNTIEFMDYSFQANGNYNINGELSNGSVSGQLDVVLPKGARIGGTLNRTKLVQDSIINYNLNLESFYYAANSNTPITIAYTLNADNLDFSNVIFNAGMEFKLNTTKAKSVILGLTAKKLLNDEKWTTGGSIYLDGTLPKKKLNISLETDYSNLVYTYGLFSKNRKITPSSYRFSTNIGDDYIINSNGKLDRGLFNNDLEMKMPYRKQQVSAKWVTETKVDIGSSKYMLISSDNVATWGDNKYANWNVLLDVRSNNGHVSMSWESSNTTKRTMDLAYRYGTEQTEGLLGPFVEVGTKLLFGGKEATCLVKAEYSKDFTAQKIAISGESSTSGKFDIQATGQISDNSRSFYNDFSLRTVDNRWFASSLVNLNPTKPSINLLYSSPIGDSKFVLNFDEKIKNYWLGNADISWVHGGEGYFKANVEAKLDSADDILVKLNLDSPTFQLLNVSVVMSNKASSDVKKKLKFDIKVSNAPLVSGMASYFYQSDEQKLVFEGDGILKMQNKSRPITFKYNRIILTNEANGEAGNRNKLYLSVDNKKNVLDLEAKFTNKGFLLKRDLYYGDNLYKLDMLYQVTMIDAMNYEKDILAHIDLKPFILNGEEFIIEGKTIKSLSNYNERLSLQWAPEKKVEYNLYSQTGKSGVSFTLPQRQIAAESAYSYKLDSMEGRFNVIGNVWFDKKRDEAQKLMVLTEMEYKFTDDRSSLIMRTNSGLQFPTFPKTISVTSGLQLSPFDTKTVDFNAVLDTFKTADRAINVSYIMFKEKKDLGFTIRDQTKLFSKGQKLETEITRAVTVSLGRMENHFTFSFLDYSGAKRFSSVDFELSPLSVYGNVQILDILKLNGKGEIGIGSNYVELKEDWNIMDHSYTKTLKLTTEPSILLIVEWKGDVKQKLYINTSISLHDYINLDVKLYDNAFKNVITLTLFLDDKRFMTSKSDIYIDNLQTVLENGKRDLLSLVNDGKKSFKAVTNHINATVAYRMKQFRNAAIDIKPTINSVNVYLANLKDEIKNDQSIVSASQNVKKLVNSISDSVLVILQQISAFLGDWIYGYNTFMEKLGDFLEDLVPNVTNLLHNTADDVSEWIRDVVQQVHQLGESIVNYIKENKDKWKEVLQSALDTFKDTLKTTYESLKKFKADVADFIDRVKKYLSSLPLTNFLQEKLEEMKNSQIPKYAYAILAEIGQGLKDSVSSTELKNLIDAILSTLDKVLNDKPYDVKTEFKSIYQNLAESIKALINSIGNSSYVRDLTDNESNWPKLSWTALRNIPNFWSAFTNFIGWLREPDFGNMEDILTTYKIGLARPSTFIPPFTKMGAIVDGQHIITLGGNYYHINGDCKYLLAGDFKNFNFTIVGDIRKGRLNSLQISSNLQSIEIFRDRVPILDQTPADYPIYGKDIYAVRKPYSIHVYVDNSVFVQCLPDLDVCTIQVSGYYYNNIFGLLGAVNAEKKLDYAKPNKSIAKDLSSFIQAYELDDNCKSTTNSPTIESIPVAANECADMFSGNSIFRRGFSFVSSQPFRSMCDLAVNSKQTAEQKLNIACKTAQAYSLISYESGFFITLPPQCAKCTIGNSLIPFGGSANAIAPQNMADIIVVLEETADNQVLYNDLLLNAAPKIQEILAGKGIKDVNFILIGYEPDAMYPSVHTTNGKITMNKNTKVAFSTAEPDVQTSYTGSFIKAAKYLLGKYNARYALQMASYYPTRPEAAKAIIQLKGQIDDIPSDKYNIYGALINAISVWNIATSKTPVFMVAPLPQISNTSSNLSEVFGFDTRNVYTPDGPKLVSNYMDIFRMRKASLLLPLLTEGSVFNSSYFVNQSGNRQQVVNALSNSIATSLTTYQRTFDCTCKYEYGIYSEPKCSIVQTDLWPIKA